MSNWRKKWPSTGDKETYILTLIQSLFIQRINIWVSGSILSAGDSFKSNIVLAFKKLIPIMWGRHIIKIISHKWWSHDEKPSSVRGLRGVLSTLLEGDQWRVSEGLVIEINLEESERTRLEILGEGCFQKQDQYVQRPWGRSILDLLEEPTKKSEWLERIKLGKQEC